MVVRGSPVHPRVGGEHNCPVNHFENVRGSSPRGRGTRGGTCGGRSNPRFIPAWAGNTLKAWTFPRQATVHPRVGGEHPQTTGNARLIFGSSPRGRGTLRSAWFATGWKRFIPAWAGNTYRQQQMWRSRTVHPRVGGEHGTRVSTSSNLIGSSPRGRGTLPVAQICHGPRRFIPAWAGNTPTKSSRGVVTSVHPRVGGEHIVLRMTVTMHAGSSPRGRGTRLRDAGPAVHTRFIPAWAGNTQVALMLFCITSVHPRVGGEHN